MTAVIIFLACYIIYVKVAFLDFFFFYAKNPILFGGFMFQGEQYSRNLGSSLDHPLICSRFDQFVRSSAKIMFNIFI